MEILNVSKTLNKYYCDICHYTCCRKSDYKKHLTTVKHNVSKNGNQMETEEISKSQKIFQCECGKIYNNRSGLWKHCKKCKTKDNLLLDNSNNIQQTIVCENLITKLLTQNQEFQKQIIEMMKDNIGNTTNNTTNNTSNTTNNKFNLNVFLNETCKDALNMSEFLESLTLCLNDFENFGPLGYCGGITNILLNGLKTLDVNKRPIHCSDLKREVIHIKNNDVWQKDEEQVQMIKAIKAIEHKNMKQMTLWAKANPEYKDANHKKSDLYTKLMDNSLGETDKEKAQKNYHKIIRNVAKEILVDKEK